MRIIRLFLICLSFALSLGQLPSQDILTLLEFKKSIKNDPTGFILDSWNDESVGTNDCPSSWNGITCFDNRVVSIVLDNLRLSADVDLTIFTNLTNLVKLSVSNNSISGKLPENLSSFKNLEHLDISNNLFSSSLPLEIGELVSLTNLSLAGNNFSGSLPDTISGLASIRTLDMSCNSLSGPLSSSLTRLRGLVYLNLSLNAFTKSIPKGFFDLMTNLDVLDLHGNNLDSTLAPEFLLLTTASHVDLSGNLLVNSVEEQQRFIVGISPSVKYLNLSHNRLTGSLVGGGVAQAFGSLKVLDLSCNQLSGELPGFNFVYDLQILKLGNNKFSGSVPNDLLKGDSLVLNELDLSGNNLSGPLSTITSTTLNTLNLSSNAISGELPLLTGSCAVLDLSRNQFSGSLLRLLKWGNIQFLDLSQNRITGPIPESTPQFLRLNHLNLSHNSLNGPLPNVITSYGKLTALDLSSNRIEGSILTALLTSPTLQELHLQSNNLSGSIDFSFSPSSSDTNLQIIDLSNNQLTGSIPDSVSNLTSLTSLDISRNHFAGLLPENLSNNLQSFNASYNNLSGIVPANLRKFPLSSFYPGNSRLQFPNPPPGSNNLPSGNAKTKDSRKGIMIAIIVAACAVPTIILIILLAVLIHCKRKSGRPSPCAIIKEAPVNPPTFAGPDRNAEDLMSPQKLSEEKPAEITDFSPSKTSHVSWSPGSGDSSYTPENNLSRLDVASSPDRLAGELYFLEDTVSFTAEELSRAPAEVLGRSSHGTCYKATLDNGLVLTVKWLREGVAKQRKEFAKEAKKFAHIRHPNVVGLRGYYWGPTQHEKLILSDHIMPGNLSSFLYDRPGRKGPPLTWAQRLKMAVDTARGLNYLHFDRAVPHGNLKSTNILLDGPDLTARVADYCLHRLMNRSGTIEQILDAGVLGYRAPEVTASKKPSPSFKSDVYAFGVVVLELLTGKCAGDVVSGEDGGGVDLTDWVRVLVADGRGSDCFDAALTAEMSVPSIDKSITEVLGIALRCIRPVSERPGIKTVYEDLSSV